MVLPEIGPVEESVPVAKGISMGGAGCVYDAVLRCLQIRRRVDGKANAGDEIDMVFYFHQYIVQKNKNSLYYMLCSNKEKNRKTLKKQGVFGSFLVRPTGFEPAAFRVGV